MSEQLLVEWLREARRVLVFCGAGVSAESGVPTFRGAGGLWEGHAVEEVATPAGFERNPQLVWRFYSQRMEGLETVQPNPAHQVLQAMEGRYQPFLLVTQNVDNLHERAGSRNLIKLHGSLMETRCSHCDEVRPLEAPVSSAAVERGELPHCSDCGGLLRPNVVWFGEYLNPEHLDRIYRFFRDGAGAATLVLVIGTSGMVSGGYGLTDLARRAGARTVEINPEPAFEGEVDLALSEPAGELLARVWPQVASRVDG